ncbi:MAG: hypothetical protein AB1645_08675 [Bacillota bacterium]|jgi:UDP-N-acetyl-D-mannosaminuronic acid dehydrogenase
MIAVVGCGRVGLPLGLCLAARGQRILGVDTDVGVREAVAERRLPFQDESAAALLEATVGRTFTMTGDLDRAIEECDTFIIALGTPLNDRLVLEQAALSEVVARLLGRRAAAGSRPPLSSSGVPWFPAVRSASCAWLSADGA